jgi:hypothetical protein
MSAATNCATCGDYDHQGCTLAEFRVGTVLAGEHAGHVEWECETLCPSCAAELDGAGRIGSMYDAGRADRARGVGCLSSNGRYLEGWHA